MAIAAIATLGSVSGCAAQPAPQQPQSQRRPPAQQDSPPEATHQDDSSSNDLSRSHGVITPPPSGDRNVLPVPNEGSSTMPVIPPPGTPGGNKDVQPK